MVGSPHSQYVPMSDGVRIAIDIWLPDEASDRSLPTVMRATKYWRRHTELRLQESVEFNRRGYAYVVMDVRGSGASFGSWRYRDRREAEDMGEIIDWIARQSWSNGRIATVGISYDANTAERALATHRTALRAAIPRFSDFDVFGLQRYPGGVPLLSFLKGWGNYNEVLDLNDPARYATDDESVRERMKGMLAGGPQPVDDDADGRLVGEAIAGRHIDPELYGETPPLTYRDEPYGPDRLPMDEASAFPYRQTIEASGAAYFAWASWFDDGTAASALSRFGTFRNYQRVVIGPWSHGIRAPALPYGTAPGAMPSLEEQINEMTSFLDPILRLDTTPGEMPEATVRYYTVGAEEWRETPVWPPAEVQPRRLYLGESNALVGALPDSDSGEDRYDVDFTATTGKTNRWFAQMGVPVEYQDRADADRKLLCYTSPPLASDLEITGHPVMSLWVRASARDFAAYVYLEVVDPDGGITHVTEGQLRAMHRARSNHAPYETYGPYHSYLKRDATPLPPGDVAELPITMWPVSILVRAQHRLRLAIAGIDSDTFARIPDEGDVTMWVQRNVAAPSSVELPVVGEIALGDSPS